MSDKGPKIHIADAGEVAEFGGKPSPPAADDSPGADESSTTDLARQVEDYKDKLLRAKAEAQNIVRRSANERMEAVRYAHADFARAMLKVLGDLDRTLESGAKAADVQAVLDGVRLVRENFLKSLAEFHVEPIEAQGTPFDPRIHEGVMQQFSADHPAGTVLAELEKGYKLHDRVLRPAKVIVSTAPADGSTGTQR